MIAWYRSLIELRKTGITESWLHPSRMNVTYDPSQSRYELRYSADDGSAVTIHARLSANGTRAEAIKIPLSGEVLLSSELRIGESKTDVFIQPNHAIIVRRLA